jgi:hypothetical protein
MNAATVWDGWSCWKKHNPLGRQGDLRRLLYPGLKPWAILFCHFMAERFTPHIANRSVRRSIENPLHEKPDLCFVFSCVFCAFLRLF